MGWIIEAEALSKHYQGRPVVDKLSFVVKKGECFGILGPNSAGKSTTLRMITGLSPKDGGKLHIFGLPMNPDRRDIPARMGVVHQEESLDPDLTVVENLLVYGGYFGIPATALSDRVAELLHFAQLTGRETEAVRHLSGGMKRRLAIARSLVNRPELVILDEPTTGLDPQARHLIWQRLRSLREQGVTLLMTTHYMEEAAQLCDRLLVMDKGKILDHGSPQELIKRHVEPEVVEIHGNNPTLVTASCRQERVGDTLICYTNQATEIIAQLQKQPDITFLHRPANLEDVFLKLTGHELRD